LPSGSEHMMACSLKSYNLSSLSYMSMELSIS